MASSKPRKASPSERARAYLLQNPNATNSEVLNVTGVSYRTLNYVKRELRAKGIVSSVYTGVGRPPHDSSGPDDTAFLREEHTPEGLPEDEDERERRDSIDEIESTGVDLEDMTPEEVRQEMVRLLRKKDTPPPVKVSAAALLEKMRTESGDELGPGAPLTHETAILRMVLLMKAFGPILTLEALNQAFNLGDQNGKAEKLHLDTQTPPPPPLQTPEPPIDNSETPPIP